MEIKGFTKTTLLDYPGHTAATLYIGGCQFKCPFCHNGSLITKASDLPNIPLDEVYHFLANRKNYLDSVCITGGEPTFQSDLPELLRHIKSMDYLIKLDTNGYDPALLNYVIKEHLVDYIAMDIKNCPEKYAKTSGFPDLDLTKIKLSIDLIQDSGIDYEFRTTVVREFHSKEDMIAIAQWLKPTSNYVLQPFVESEDIIMPLFTSYSMEELCDIKKAMEPYLPSIRIRGFE